MDHHSGSPQLTANCRNHGLSIRSKKKDGHGKERSKRHFNMSSLRGMTESESTSKLSQIIQTERHAISATASAASDRASVATQLSLWGLSTNDDSVSEISDKVGVIMSELAEQEDIFTQSLEDYRSLMKKIKDIEKSVQPSRDNKKDTSDEIQKLKYKDPSSTKLVTLEQELVRAEAQNLVAEAQLTNNVCGTILLLSQILTFPDAAKTEGGLRHPFRCHYRASPKAAHPCHIRPTVVELL